MTDSYPPREWDRNVQVEHDEVVSQVAGAIDLTELAGLDPRLMKQPDTQMLLAMCVLLARGIERQQRQITRLQTDLDAVKNALDGIG